MGKNRIVKTWNAGCGSTQLSKQAHIKMANRSSTALCTFIPRENGLQDDSAISKQCLTHLSCQKIRKMAEINVPFTFRLHNKAPHSIPMDATDVYLDGNDLGNFTSQVKWYCSFKDVWIWMSYCITTIPFVLVQCSSCAQLLGKCNYPSKRWIVFAGIYW